MLGKRFDELLHSLQTLPGVGPKSAQRIAFHLLSQQRERGLLLAHHLEEALQCIQHCEQCGFYTETRLCQICEDPSRQAQTLCVVESVADVVAIESTGQYRGLYFVLHGHLSPIDGIDAETLRLPLLFSRLRQGELDEVILATNNTIEGDATALYIANNLKDWSGTCSRIASGIPMGGEIEYLDGRTVCHALMARAPLQIEDH